MDPLSITTAVVTLTGVCVTTAKRINDLCTRFNLTFATLVAILNETRMVTAALSQIQGALVRLTSQLEQNALLLQTLDTALTGCTVVVLALQQEIEKLEAGIFREKLAKIESKMQSSWILRMKVLWKESTMKDLLVQIRGQQASLSVLLQALTVHSISDLNNLITQNSSTLVQLSENTMTLRKSYPSIRAPHSLFAADRTDGVSVFSHAAFSAGVTEFDFDNFIFDSPVYRRAFMRGYLKPRRSDDSDSLSEASETDDEGTGNDEDKSILEFDWKPRISRPPVSGQLNGEEKFLEPAKQSDTNAHKSIPLFTTVLSVPTIGGDSIAMNADDVVKLTRELRSMKLKYEMTESLLSMGQDQITLLLSEFRSLELKLPLPVGGRYLSQELIDEVRGLQHNDQTMDTQVFELEGSSGTENNNKLEKDNKTKDNNATESKNAVGNNDQSGSDDEFESASEGESDKKAVSPYIRKILDLRPDTELFELFELEGDLVWR